MPYIQKISYDAVLSRENNVLIYEKKIDFKRSFEFFKISLFPFSILKVSSFFLINFIPVIGPLIILFFQSSSRGLLAHKRYFKLKNFTKSEIKEIYKINKPSYMAFGLSALMFESIPMLNLFFIFTNTIGAALWVVDIENNEPIEEENFNEIISIQNSIS
ncbi:unnamed protein product [Candida verbasci]|uniref:Uncharacterized protein n=1 Tax=Candida verbasci TaxID=1227364 RepID=A0A9W4TT51_9ASCO|nr:unnamed protein product [Candida verbasci]